MGYKNYQLDLSRGVLSGTWDRFIPRDDSRIRATATASKNLDEATLLHFKKSLINLNDSIATVDKSECGRIQDGPANVLILMRAGDEVHPFRIAEAGNVGGTCADAYVNDKSLEPILESFHTLLPEPADDAAYKPATP